MIPYPIFFRALKTGKLLFPYLKAVWDMETSVYLENYHHAKFHAFNRKWTTEAHSFTL